MATIDAAAIEAAIRVVYDGTDGADNASLEVLNEAMQRLLHDLGIEERPLLEHTTVSSRVASQSLMQDYAQARKDDDIAAGVIAVLTSVHGIAMQWFVIGVAAGRAAERDA